MVPRRVVGLITLVAAVALAAGCREIPESIAPLAGDPATSEERDFFYLGGTRYAEAVPGTDMYYVYNVRFTRPGADAMYTLEELVSLEEQGLLKGEDRIDRVWLRSESPVPGSEVLSGRTVIRFSESEEEQPPHCPTCWTWNARTHQCECESWTCVKCLYH